MKRAAIILIFFFSTTLSVFAQTTIRVTDPATGITTNVGDSARQAIRVSQAPGGTVWTFNWTQLLGAAPSATNPMPSRLTDGAVFIDPRSIRLLTSSDVVTAVGPVTDTQLRATPVPISGTVTTGGLTDTQLRASAVPISLATAPTTPVTGTFWQTTQPVSGTFFQATQPISATALPLPAGASTSALQTTGNTSLASIDTKTPALGQALAAASVPVILPTATITTLTPPTTVTVTQAIGTNLHTVVDSVPTTPVTGTFFQATQPISATALPLPAGAATSALQTAGNTSLASIDTKTPALGQALAAASVPIVLTAAQLTTLTPVVGLTDTQIRATPLPVSGTVTANAGTGTMAVSLATAPTTPVTGTFWQATQPVSGTVTANAGTGTMAVSLATAPTTPVTGTFWQATQPVSGTITTTPPANASTNVAQMGGVATSMNTGVRDTGTQRVTIATNDVVPVTGTFFQTTQPVSIATMPSTPVTGTFFQATQPVSLTTLPALTAGSAVIGHTINDTGSTTAVTGNVAVTSAGLTNLDVALSTRTKPADQQHAIIDSGTTVVTQPTGSNLHVACDSGCAAGTPGQTTMALSSPVVIANNQSAIPVTLTSTTVTGTVATSLATLPALTAGSAVIGHVITDSGSTTAVTGNVAVTNTGLSNIPAQGQALAAASLPVVLTAAQQTALTPPTTITANSGTGNAVISTVNSSTATLGIGAVFTGTSEDITEYADIRIAIFADQVSATDGLSIQQSTNGTNWDIVDAYTIPASTGKTIGIQAAARFFRIVYTNGGVAQGAFRLATIFRKTAPNPSSVRPQDARPNDNDMVESIAYLSGWNGATWDRVKTAVGGLQTTYVESVRTAGTLTSTTCPGTGCVSVVTTNYALAAVTINGTYSITPVFEISDDGANFYSTTCTRTDSPVQETTGGALVNTLRAWDCSVYGTTSFRVRASVFTSGTANIGVILTGTPIEAASTVALATGANIIGALTANQSENMAQVGGTATVNGGLAGTLAVGGTQASNAAITANPVLVGIETVAAGSTVTAATAGNIRRQAGDVAGNVFNVLPAQWTCNLQALAATLTQCQAAPAAGYSLYITSWIATTTTTTAGTYAIRYGTGAACVTTPIGVWPQPGGAAPSRVVTAPLSTGVPQVINLGPVGFKVAAANAVCVIGTATNTIDISISGYIAP